MTLNRELFVEDPTEREIPNLGVAKVLNPESEEEFAVLRWELSHFVCDGEYEHGLQRILESYLRNLERDAQPAAWVSGFYGSGKSHLVRVLQYLWTDYPFPDGSTATGLVNLPSSVSDPLGELRTVGKREGGLWAAAGTLGAGAGDSVRLAFLGIILRAAGLPERVEPAQFVLWLNSEGLLDGVRAGVEAAGKPWAKELRNLYVSPVIAEALLSAQPDFANSPADARSLLKTQFPPVSDITDEEFLNILRGVLDMQSDKPGRIPATLIVLDELQQYINDDVQRMLDVQTVVEACCTKFDSKVLVVSTGQSALQATPVLQKLQGRYMVRASLADTDIDSVVRRVVLLKRADKVDVLQAKLDQVSGEIDRQLAGSKIAPVGEDADDLVPLYPILPARQRFWERVLRAIDPGGTAGQLRTQLQTVHEATRAVALDPIGVVVAGDFVYDQQAAGMLETGVMPRETYDEEVSPIFSDKKYRERVILGGDLNLTTQWSNEEGVLDRARGVFERIAAYGLVDCLEVRRGDDRLPGCLCTLEPCTHTRTKWDADLVDGGYPHQMDYLFASRSLAEGDRLVSCNALEPEEWKAYSDHAPIVATFKG